MNIRHRESQSILAQPIAVIGLGLAIIGITLAVVFDPPQSVWEWAVIVIAYDVMISLMLVRLTLTVTDSHVQVRMALVWRRDIALLDITVVEVVDYHPVRQFGGWGWRFGRGGARQYAMAGKTAVRLSLLDGTQVYLGSADPARLAEVISEARSAPRASGV